MKVPVFISWGGERSKHLALVLHKYLPRILQAAKPWVSPRDIAAGAQWSLRLAEALASAQFGLIAVTRAALVSPFVHLEAGAMWKALSDTHVCPLLFDELKPADVTAPMSMFQMKSGTDSHDMLAVLSSINALLKDDELPEDVLKDAFDRVWPELERAIADVPADSERKGPPPAVATRDDKLDEVLALLRSLDHRMTPALAAVGKGAFSPSDAIAAQVLSRGRPRTIRGGLFSGPEEPPSAPTLLGGRE